MTGRPRDPQVPRDPSGIEQPHDVLAAEEFAMPSPEERYPADPSGIEQPHDVLAAEEFAMPSPDAPAGGQDGSSRRWLALGFLGAAVIALLARRR
jgi:hypothetical protein